MAVGGWWVVGGGGGGGVGKERLATIEGERRRRETCEAQVNEWRKRPRPSAPSPCPLPLIWARYTRFRKSHYLNYHGRVRNTSIITVCCRDIIPVWRVFIWEVRGGAVPIEETATCAFTSSSPG